MNFPKGNMASAIIALRRNVIFFLGLRSLSFSIITFCMISCNSPSSDLHEASQFTVKQNEDTIGYHEDGLWNIVDDHGNLVERGSYFGGRRIGEWTGYGFDNRVMWKGRFFDYPEKPNGFVMQKQIDFDSLPFDSVPFGEDDQFGDSEAMMSRWGFDKKQGLWRFFDQDSKLSVIEMYDEGRLVWSIRN
jgi:hypothetical protein